MTTWDRNFTGILLALLLALWLTGCTYGLPQAKLLPPVEENLGRELVVRLNGKVLNPIDEPLVLGANAEVDVRVEVLGAKMYGRGPLWAMLAAFPLPVLGTSSYPNCAEHRQWKTDTMCTCKIELFRESESILAHEIEHCKGYGEL